MLTQQANDDQNPAQFIITTFHPQIVHVADKIYGASHRNRISSVVRVEKEDALEFLQAEEKRAVADPKGDTAKRKMAESEENQENDPAIAMDLE